MDAHELKHEMQNALPFLGSVTLHDYDRKIRITILHSDGNPAFLPMEFSVQIMLNKMQRDAVVQNLALQLDYKLGRYAPHNS